MSQIDDQRRERAIQNRMNPIRGLNPRDLARTLDEFKQGYLRKAALLWDAMIRRDLLVRNVVSKRCKAVARAQWEILTVDDSPEALRQKRVLEKVYNNCTVTNALDANERGGFGLLLRLMMMAQGFRYAAFDMVWRQVKGSGRQIGSSQRRPRQSGGEAQTEITATADDNPETFLTFEATYCPLEFFENTSGRLRFLRQDFDLKGEEMKPGDWLVAVGDGIMEATSVAYCYKHMSLKDWVACSEAFGTPIPWGRTDANKGSDEWNDLEAALRQMMAQRCLLTSSTAQIELIEMSGGTGQLPFPPLVELMDRAIASLWRGADLSTISQGQAGVGATLQGEESDLLLEDDAKWLAEILWDQVDLPALRYALGVEEALAYVSILPPKRKNVEQDIRIDEFLLRNGYPLSRDDASERFGRPMAEPGEPLLAGAAPAAPGAEAPAKAGGANPAKGLENSESMTRMRQAKARLMAPILQRLRVIDGLEGEQKKMALLALQAELPGLRVEMENAAAAGEVVDALEEEMRAALLEGFGISNRGDKR